VIIVTLLLLKKPLRSSSSRNYQKLPTHKNQNTVYSEDDDRFTEDNNDQADTTIDIDTDTDTDTDIRK